MYKVQKLTHKHRVLVTFQGNFEDHDPAKFLADLQSAALEVRDMERGFDLLVDWLEASAMPQQDAKHGEDTIAWCLANGMRKSANVMNTIVQRMQVKRVSAQDDRFGYFETHAEAERWLDEA